MPEDNGRGCGGFKKFAVKRVKYGEYLRNSPDKKAAPVCAVPPERKTKTKEKGAYPSN